MAKQVPTDRHSGTKIEAVASKLKFHVGQSCTRKKVNFFGFYRVSTSRRPRLIVSITSQIATSRPMRTQKGFKRPPCGGEAKFRKPHDLQNTRHRSLFLPPRFEHLTKSPHEVPNNILSECWRGLDPVLRSLIHLEHKRFLLLRRPKTDDCQN